MFAFGIAFGIAVRFAVRFALGIAFGVAVRFAVRFAFGVAVRFAVVIAARFAFGVGGASTLVHGGAPLPATVSSVHTMPPRTLGSAIVTCSGLPAYAAVGATKRRAWMSPASTRSYAEISTAGTAGAWTRATCQGPCSPRNSPGGHVGACAATIVNHTESHPPGLANTVGVSASWRLFRGGRSPAGSTPVTLHPASGSGGATAPMRNGTLCVARYTVVFARVYTAPNAVAVVGYAASMAATVLVRPGTRRSQSWLPRIRISGVLMPVTSDTNTSISSGVAAPSNTSPQITVVCRSTALICLNRAWYARGLCRAVLMCRSARCRIRIEIYGC